MEIIKEYCSPRNKCIVRAKDFFAHDLQSVMNLFEKARKDFPSLKQKKVKVVFYRDRTIGIEFTVKNGKKVPENYVRIKKTQPIY